MRTLIEIWEEIWGYNPRRGRIQESIWAIGGYTQNKQIRRREFLTDAISQSRSLNIVKKLYFGAPIEKRNMENPVCRSEQF